MTGDRDLADVFYRSDFGAFTYSAFNALNPGQPLIANWHIDAICFRVQKMVIGDARKRLILNLPPRTLKSFIASVALPAWLLGHNPSSRVICPATPINFQLNSPATAGRCSRPPSTNAYFPARN
jgi:hypothetical protein